MNLGYRMKNELLVDFQSDANSGEDSVFVIIHVEFEPRDQINYEGTQSFLIKRPIFMRILGSIIYL